MNRACKNCESHRYIPKDSPFGIGMHWCDKFNSYMGDVKCCLKRTINSHSQESMKQKDKMIFSAY